MRKPQEPQKRSTSLLKRFDKINLEYFGGHVCGGIGWRNLPLGKESSDITQALCDFEERIIHVNSVMDDIRIPLWYLDFVLYHEMLHLQHGPQQYSETEYAYPHSLRFKCMEAKHPNYKRATEFEEKKLRQIVRSWRKWREWERFSKQKKRAGRLAAKR